MPAQGGHKRSLYSSLADGALEGSGDDFGVLEHLLFVKGLARDGVYRFAYIAVPNRIKGPSAGFALRPLALR